MEKTRLILFWCFFLLNITIVAVCTAQEDFGSFIKEGSFSITIDSENGQLKGFCYGDDYLYAISYKGYIVKIDTTGNIVWTRHSGLGSTYSGFDGAICFDQDTLWIIKNGWFAEIHAFDTSGRKLSSSINFKHLSKPYYGGTIGGMIKDENTFWLLKQDTPLLFQIDRNGNIIKHFATSWLDYWSPTIGIWGDKILKITDSHTPTNIFNNVGVLAFDKNTGAVTDVWDIPKDFTGSMYLGISKSQNNLWAAQFDVIDKLLTVHCLAFPDPLPPPHLPTSVWGDFEIVDWAYCPIRPSMIEGLYGFGYDQSTKTFWFGNGIYDFVGAQETTGRYLSIVHFSHQTRKYDIAVHNDTLWCVHYWAGLSTASVSEITIENDSVIVHSAWETGLEQAHGLAIDGSNIWVSGRDTALTLTDRNNHIVKFDRHGNKLAHFVYPDDNDHNYEDLAWHQGGLWAITRSLPFGKDVIIQKLDPDTGELLESFNTGWVPPAQFVWATLASDGTSLMIIATTSSGTSDFYENEHIRILKLQTLQPAAPIAGFTAEPRIGPAPLTVQFTDTSSGDIQSWFWDFGDGQTSVEQHPSHTYLTADTFTVFLSVTGPAGSNTMTQENYIIVEPTTSVSDLINSIPKEYCLYQNHPNPFNSTTNISYALPKSGEVSIKIYDLNGKLIATLTKSKMPAGNHIIFWNASNLPSGIYVIKYQAVGFTQTKKCILLK